MKHLKDWLIPLIVGMAMLGGCAYAYRPAQPTQPDPALAEIRAELAEIRTTVRDVYDQQSYEIWARDWRSK